ARAGGWVGWLALVGEAPRRAAEGADDLRFRMCRKADASLGIWGRRYRWGRPREPDARLTPLLSQGRPVRFRSREPRCPDQRSLAGPGRVSREPLPPSRASVLRCRQSPLAL